ncbi:MAG: FIVAR domain-containing protein [Clostridiales bacterium]|nr:FIVAR domain-containing protein [Clostridiales bacterium]
MKKFFKKITTFILAAVMVFSCCGITAMAASDDYTHGTISVTTDTTTVEEGDTVSITVYPYVHIQYKGCGMSECPDICGTYGAKCFITGYGCCCDTTPVTYTADVTVTISDTSIISVTDSITANGTVSSAGDMVSGTMTLTAAAAGTATVTVSASLNDWVSTTKTFTIAVSDGEGSGDDDTEDVNTEALAEEYAICAALDSSDYTSASYKALTTVMAEAKKVLDGDLVYTQEEVDDLTSSLQAARLALVVVLSGDIPDQDTDNYYLLEDADDLVWFSSMVNKGATELDARLARDIDLSDVDEWTPIGLSDTNLYTGTFDGQGYTISGLKMVVTDDDDERYGGLFANLNGTLKNVVLTDSTVSCDSLAGGLVGRAYPDSLVINCGVSNSVKIYGNAMYGGLIGNAQGTLINSYSHSPGGFVGVAPGKIENCLYVGDAEYPYASMTNEENNRVYIYFLGNQYDETGKYGYTQYRNGKMVGIMNSYTNSEYEIYAWKSDDKTLFPVLDFTTTL